MTPRSELSIDEHLAWAHWWAFPWENSHQDWKGDAYPLICALFHRQRSTPGGLTGVEASLPPPPNPTVLRLTLACAEQLDLALTLVHDTFNPQAATSLSSQDHLWCLRLSKALPPAMLPPGADPLQLLRSWVEPAIWQRLRLRFSRQRVQAVERDACENASNRLSTLWQAVVWRVTTREDEPRLLIQTGKDSSDVMPTHA